VGGKRIRLGKGRCEGIGGEGRDLRKRYSNLDFYK
jgi:hypothetical protein